MSCDNCDCHEMSHEMSKPTLINIIPHGHLHPSPPHTPHTYTSIPSPPHTPHGHLHPSPLHTPHGHLHPPHTPHTVLEVPRTISWITIKISRTFNCFHSNRRQYFCTIARRGLVHIILLLFVSVMLPWIRMKYSVNWHLRGPACL